jgi:hypothetical protein
MESCVPKCLIHVDISQTGHNSLIQEQGLQLSVAFSDQAVKALRRERFFQGFRSQMSQNLGGIRRECEAR